MLSRKVATLVLLAMGMTASGCSTFVPGRYSISADNVSSLRAHRGHTIHVGDFTSPAPRREFACRAAGPLVAPDNETFTEFVRKALVAELKIAELYAETAPVTLTGTLDHLDFSSTSGTWDLTMTVKSSNGRRLTVSEQYKFETSFVAETACNQTAQAFGPGVQNLIGKLVSHPEFAALIQAPAQAPSSVRRSAAERPEVLATASPSW
jgi:hypothetical protein